MASEINSAQNPIYERVKNYSHTPKAWKEIGDEATSIIHRTEDMLHSKGVKPDEIKELDGKIRDLRKAMVDNLENRHIITPGGDSWVLNNNNGINAKAINAVFEDLQPLLAVSLYDEKPLGEDKKTIEKDISFSITTNEQGTVETTDTRKGFFNTVQNTKTKSDKTTDVNGIICEENKDIQQKIQEDLNKISNIAFERQFENATEEFSSMTPKEYLKNLQNGNLEKVLTNTTFIEPENKEKFKEKIIGDLSNTIEDLKKSIEESKVEKKGAIKGTAIGLTLLAASITALVMPFAIPYELIVCGSTLGFITGGVTSMVSADKTGGLNNNIKLDQETISTYDKALSEFKNLEK